MQFNSGDIHVRTIPETFEAMYQVMCYIAATPEGGLVIAPESKLENNRSQKLKMSAKSDSDNVKALA